MKWEKIGKIFDPSQLKDSNLTAALMPTVEVLNAETGLVRVFFSPRDRDNRSQIRSFDFFIDDPFDVFNISPNPILSRGKLGAFDDAGLTIGSICKFDEKKLVYYTGWNLTQSVPYNNSIGVAELSGQIATRLGDGPIMTRTLNEPYSCASPCVLIEKNLFRMWYASMDKWDITNNELRHYYDIKYAESKDGINWKRSGAIAISYANEEEYAFGRPFVLKESQGYEMWYSFRGASYQIGLARSKDGKNWIRSDHNAGIEVSSYGWDSEMITYPNLFDCRGNRYMLYNGNGYGKSGIGLAKLIRRA